MNAERRKRVAAVRLKIEECFHELAELANDENEAYSNLPEGLQSSERGEAMQEAIGTLENAANSLESEAVELESLEDA